MENLERMKFLVKTLNEANKSYYDENKEIISNKKYDDLYDELQSLEKELGVTLSRSPTSYVGFETATNLEKKTHKTPMLSLDKTKEIETLKNFLKKGEGLLSYKLDGLTIILEYEDGILTSALTRGNGLVGEVVTHNAMHFTGVPLKIPFKGSLSIRGEGIITYSDFEIINEFSEYKNPRNLCSGTVRQLDSSSLVKRPVHFLAFGIMEGEGISKKTKKSQELYFLKSLGFSVSPYVLVNYENIESEVLKYKEEVKNSDFPTDGLVLTYDDIQFSLSLGSTSKFPRDSIAFKWEDESKETKIIKIEWNTSRTSLITPTAVFETVELEGTSVSKASLHNLSIIEELKIGIGDIVTVYKANMIIPQIDENLTKSGPLTPPSKCPMCSFPTEIKQKSESKTLHCTNPICSAKIIKKLTHFVSRNAMNISGFSEMTLTKFLKHGFIKSYLDIFSLVKYKKELENLEGFGEKSVEKMLLSIEKSLSVSLANVIYALGIEGIGLSTSKTLCAHFGYDVEKILNAKKEDLMEIEGFGEILCENFAGYFESKEERANFEELLSLLTLQNNFANFDMSDKGKLSNITFVITGSTQIYKNRDEIKSIIEENGGKVSSSVSKNTNYLINNDIESSSSKNKKARELGIQIIDELSFKSMLL